MTTDNTTTNPFSVEAAVARAAEGNFPNIYGDAVSPVDLAAAGVDQNGEPVEAPIEEAPAVVVEEAPAAAQPAAEAPAEEKSATEAEAPEGETLAQKRSRLRNKAERFVLENHREEFEDYAEQLYAENGLKFNRRLTGEAKAQREAEKLIAENPGIAAALLAKLAAAQTADQPNGEGTAAE